MKLLEAIVGSFGILLFGVISIPIVGALSGVAINLTQGAQMSAIFFVGRILWLYAVRRFFSWWLESKK